MIPLLHYKYTNKFIDKKARNFKLMYYPLLVYAFLLILLLTLTVFYQPSSSAGVSYNKTLHFGFYYINIVNGVFSDLEISWGAATLTAFSIIYLIYLFVFYWMYWNSEWMFYVKNTRMLAFLIISTIIVTGAILIGYINSPFFNFEKLNPVLGLDNSNIMEGYIFYNFIYNNHFIKNNQGIIVYDVFYLSEYGYLCAVISGTLLCLFLFVLVVMNIRRYR